MNAGFACYCISCLSTIICMYALPSHTQSLITDNTIKGDDTQVPYVLRDPVDLSSLELKVLVHLISWSLMENISGSDRLGPAMSDSSSISR